MEKYQQCGLVRLDGAPERRRGRFGCRTKSLNEEEKDRPDREDGSKRADMGVAKLGHEPKRERQGESKGRYKCGCLASLCCRYGRGLGEKGDGFA